MLLAAAQEHHRLQVAHAARDELYASYLDGQYENQSRQRDVHLRCDANRCVVGCRARRGLTSIRLALAGHSWRVGGGSDMVRLGASAGLNLSMQSYVNVQGPGPLPFDLQVRATLGQ